MFIRSKIKLENCTAKIAPPPEKKDKTKIKIKRTRQIKLIYLSGTYIQIDILGVHITMGQTVPYLVRCQ